MLKDYIPDTAPAAGERDFIERHWTQVWQRQESTERRLAKVERQPEWRVLRRHLEALPRGARVLDGGCGLGEWTLLLSRRGFETVGLDISRETVDALRRLFPETRFHVRDIRETGFPDASFDLYFSWGVFEHFEEGLQGCVREARRILKPGGLLLVSVPFANLRVRARRRLGRDAAATSGAGKRFYQWRLTADELRAELSSSFEVIGIEPIHKRQGLARLLHHELGLPHGWVGTRALAAGLAPLVPGAAFAHMLLAVARRPAGP